MTDELIGKKLLIKINASGKEVLAYKHISGKKFIFIEDCRTEVLINDATVLKIIE